MSHSTIKFYIIPGIIAVVIVVILLLIPINKKSVEEVGTVRPTVVINLPTKTIAPDMDIEIITSPTIIPPQPFTGAEVNQEIPQDLKLLGEEKTALRRLLPLTLPFGTVEFDYENDIFVVKLNKPELLTDFQVWIQKNYPSIPVERFAIE